MKVYILFSIPVLLLTIYLVGVNGQNPTASNQTKLENGTVLNVTNPVTIDLKNQSLPTNGSLVLPKNSEESKEANRNSSTHLVTHQGLIGAKSTPIATGVPVRGLVIGSDDDDSDAKKWAAQDFHPKQTHPIWNYGYDFSPRSNYQKPAYTGNYNYNNYNSGTYGGEKHDGYQGASSYNVGQSRNPSRNPPSFFPNYQGLSSQQGPGISNSPPWNQNIQFLPGGETSRNPAFVNNQGIQAETGNQGFNAQNPGFFNNQNFPPGGTFPGPNNPQSGNEQGRNPGFPNSGSSLQTNNPGQQNPSGFQGQGPDFNGPNAQSPNLNDQINRNPQARPRELNLNNIASTGNISQALPQRNIFPASNPNNGQRVLSLNNRPTEGPQISGTLPQGVPQGVPSTQFPNPQNPNTQFVNPQNPNSQFNNPPSANNQFNNPQNPNDQFRNPAIPNNQFNNPQNLNNQPNNPQNINNQINNLQNPNISPQNPNSNPQNSNNPLNDPQRANNQIINPQDPNSQAVSPQSISSGPGEASSPNNALPASESQGQGVPPQQPPGVGPEQRSISSGQFGPNSDQSFIHQRQPGAIPQNSNPASPRRYDHQRYGGLDNAYAFTHGTQGGLQFDSDSYEGKVPSYTALSYQQQNGHYQQQPSIPVTKDELVKGVPIPWHSGQYQQQYQSSVPGYQGEEKDYTTPTHSNEKSEGQYVSGGHSQYAPGVNDYQNKGHYGPEKTTTSSYGTNQGQYVSDTSATQNQGQYYSGPDHPQNQGHYVTAPTYGQNEGEYATVPSNNYEASVNGIGTIQGYSNGYTEQYSHQSEAQKAFTQGVYQYGNPFFPYYLPQGSHEHQHGGSALPSYQPAGIYPNQQNLPVGYYPAVVTDKSVGNYPDVAVEQNYVYAGNLPQGGYGTYYHGEFDEDATNKTDAAKKPTGSGILHTGTSHKGALHTGASHTGASHTGASHIGPTHTSVPHTGSLAKTNKTSSSNSTTNPRPKALFVLDGDRKSSPDADYGVPFYHGGYQQGRQYGTYEHPTPGYGGGYSNYGHAYHYNSPEPYSEKGYAKYTADNIIQEIMVNCQESSIYLQIKLKQPFTGYINEVNDEKSCPINKVHGSTLITINLPAGSSCLGTGYGNQYYQTQRKLEMVWEEELQTAPSIPIQVLCQSDPYFTEFLKASYEVYKDDLKPVIAFGKLPRPILFLQVEKDGYPLSRPAYLGESLSLYYTMGIEHLQFDSDVLSCWTFDRLDNDNYGYDNKADGVEVIANGCPTKPVFTYGRYKQAVKRGQYNTVDIRYNFKAFHLPGSYRIWLKCKVRVCYGQCSDPLPPCGNEDSYQQGYNHGNDGSQYPQPGGEYGKAPPTYNSNQNYEGGQYNKGSSGYQQQYVPSNNYQSAPSPSSSYSGNTQYGKDNGQPQGYKQQRGYTQAPQGGTYNKQESYNYGEQKKPYNNYQVDKYNNPQVNNQNAYQPAGSYGNQQSYQEYGQKPENHYPDAIQGGGTQSGTNYQGSGYPTKAQAEPGYQGNSYSANTYQPSYPASKSQPGYGTPYSGSNYPSVPSPGGYATGSNAQSTVSGGGYSDGVGPGNSFRGYPGTYSPGYATGQPSGYGHSQGPSYKSNNGPYYGPSPSYGQAQTLKYGAAPDVSYGSNQGPGYAPNQGPGYAPNQGVNYGYKQGGQYAPSQRYRRSIDKLTSSNIQFIDDEVNTGKNQGNKTMSYREFLEKLETWQSKINGKEVFVELYQVVDIENGESSITSIVMPEVEETEE